MNTWNSPAVVRPSRSRPAREAVAAITRERAAALFDSPWPLPAAVKPGKPLPARTAGRIAGPPSVHETAEPPPAPPPPPPEVQVFDGAPLGRLRAWLFVRCGLEFKTVVALAVVLAAAGGLAFHHYWTGRPRALALPPPVTAPPRARPAEPAAPPQVTVDIAGKVARPGLRRLPKGSRVADALAAAGGPLPGTDTTTLNLARPLMDGEQILVGPTPSTGFAAPGGPGAPAGPGTSGGPNGGPATPLSLNSAGAAQLDALPGVGPVLAQHILDYRNQHGGFTSLQQLRQVPGIGDRKFGTLKSLVQP